MRSSSRRLQAVSDAPPRSEFVDRQSACVLADEADAIRSDMSEQGRHSLIKGADFYGTQRLDNRDHSSERTQVARSPGVTESFGSSRRRQLKQLGLSDTHGAVLGPDRIDRRAEGTFNTTFLFIVPAKRGPFRDLLLLPDAVAYRERASTPAPHLDFVPEVRGLRAAKLFESMPVSGVAKSQPVELEAELEGTAAKPCPVSRTAPLLLLVDRSASVPGIRSLRPGPRFPSTGSRAPVPEHRWVHQGRATRVTCRWASCATATR
jgi:hypothetical protein